MEVKWGKIVQCVFTYKRCMVTNKQLMAWQNLASISGPSLGKHGWWKGLFDCSHFILQGGKTGYSGFPSFDTVWYSKKRNSILHNFPANWWREQSWQKYPTRINLPVSWAYVVAIFYSYLSLCDFMWVLIEKNSPEKSSFSLVQGYLWASG